VYKTSWLIESPSHCKESANWKISQDVRFSSSLERVIAENQIDIFFSSGTIQYLVSPLDPLIAVANAGIPLVALTRNNFAATSRIVAQRATLAMNGTGSHLQEYGNLNIYYPNTSIVKAEVVDIFCSKGYNVLLDTSGTSCGVYGNGNYSGDLVFKKSDPL